MQYLENLEAMADEGNQAAGMKKPIVMPDFYKGDLDEDWEDWIANFKACAEINEWDDDLKCKFLGVRMKGTALKVYHDLDAGVKTNWNNLCTTLENRFKTVQQPQFYKSRFLILKREQGETLRDLGNRVRTLARKTYPDINAKLRDELAQDQFVRSLENVEMILKLRHCMPETLDDAIRIAIDWQTVEADVRNQKYGENVEQSLEKKGGTTCVASAQKSSSLEVMMKEMLTLLKEDREARHRQEQHMTFGRGRGRGRGTNNKCFNCGSEDHFKRDCPRNKTCWICGGTGHLRNQCPNQSNQSGNGNRLE